MGTGLKALGERQVNFTIDGGADGVAGTQADPAVTALANGDFVAVYENPQAGDSLLAHFFDASGNAIGPPVSSGLAERVVNIDPAAHVSVHPAVAATPNGGFLVAYVDTSVTAANPVTHVPLSPTASMFAATTRPPDLALPLSSTRERGPVHPTEPRYGRTTSPSRRLRMGPAWLRGISTSTLTLRTTTSISRFPTPAPTDLPPSTGRLSISAR